MFMPSTPGTRIERAVRLRDEQYRSVMVVVLGFEHTNTVVTKRGYSSESTYYRELDAALEAAGTLIATALDSAEATLLDYTRVESLEGVQTVTPEDMLHIAEHIRSLYPTSDNAQREALLTFARNAPMAYGHWSAWKWLLKQAMDTDDVGLLSQLLPRLDKPMETAPPLPFKDMPFLGQTPDIRTIRYLERRARRYMAGLGVRDPEAYHDIAASILASTAGTTLNLRRQPLTFDILYGRSPRFMHSPYSTGIGTSAGNFSPYTREEQFPEIWDLHLETAHQLLQNGQLPFQTREFAARALLASAHPAAIITHEERVGLSKSYSPLLRMLAAQQRLEAALQSADSSAGEFGSLYWQSDKATRERIVEVAKGSPTAWLLEFIKGMGDAASRYTPNPTPSPRVLVNLMDQLLERAPDDESRKQLTAAMLASRITLVWDQLFTAWQTILPREAAEWSAIARDHGFSEQDIHEIWSRVARTPIPEDELVDLLPGYCAARQPAITRKLVLETPLRESALLRRVVATPNVATSRFQLTLCDQLNRALLQAHPLMTTNWEAARQDVVDRLLPYLASSSIPGLSQAAWHYVFEQPGWLAQHPGFLGKQIGAAKKKRNLYQLLADPRIIDALPHEHDALQRLADLPYYIKDLPQPLLEQIIGMQSGRQRIGLIALLNDARWDALADFVFQVLEEGGAVDFWISLAGHTTGKTGLTAAERLKRDDRFVAQFHRVCNAEVIRALDGQSADAVITLALQWLHVREQSESPPPDLLKATLWHPVANIRAWGANALEEVGVQPGMIISLVEDFSPEMREKGEEFISRIQSGNQIELDVVAGLLDSHSPNARRRGLQYLQESDLKRAATLTAATLARLGPHAPAEFVQYATGLALQGALPATAAGELIGQLLQGNMQTRRQGMEWVERNPHVAGPLLLQTARGGSSSMQDWALQQLTGLAIAGHVVEGFELVGPVEEQT